MFWPPHYTPIDDPEQRRGFENQLSRELTPSHLLFGVPVTAIARGLNEDSVLFALCDGTWRVAAVHLTWTSHERDPWPNATMYDSLEDWAEHNFELET
jgi:hypothetical protein